MLLIRAFELLYGVVLLLVGLNGLYFKKGKPVMSPDAQAAYDGLIRARFVFPVAYSSLILAGILLLGHIAVPFALVLASPAVLSIYLFNVIVQQNYFSPGLFFCLFNIGLAIQNWPAFEALIQ